MRIVSLLIALVLSTVLTSTTPQLAIAKAPRADAVLRGSTTFSSTVPGSIRFYLPTRVNIRQDFDFEVKGAGRAYGFSFSKSGGEGGWAPGVEQVFLGLCETRGCRSKDGGGFAFVHGDHLPAGGYDMYVVADGAPVDITFTVATLRGRAAYQATPIDAELKTLTPNVDISHGAQTFSAGAFTELPESDWTFFGMWALDRNEVATAYGSCSYNTGNNVPPPPSEVAFLPGCPLSDNFEFINEGPDGGSVLMVSHHGGPEGSGGWFTAGSSHARYGAIAFWMDI